MLPYLCLGCLAKQYIENINYLIPKIGFVGLVILLMEYITKFPMPTHDYNIGVSIISFPFHIVNVILGTALILWLSKLISKNMILQLIGKGTLIIYLLNECVLKAIIYIFCPICSNHSTLEFCMFYGTVYIFAVLFFIILINIIYGTRYLSWIVGKY